MKPPLSPLYICSLHPTVWWFRFVQLPGALNPSTKGALQSKRFPYSLGLLIPPQGALQSKRFPYYVDGQAARCPMPFLLKNRIALEPNQPPNRPTQNHPEPNRLRTEPTSHQAAMNRLRTEPALNRTGPEPTSPELLGTEPAENRTGFTPSCAELIHAQSNRDFLV